MPEMTIDIGNWLIGVCAGAVVLVVLIIVVLEIGLGDVS